jgi:hypothetical protein
MLTHRMNFHWDQCSDVTSSSSRFFLVLSSIILSHIENRSVVCFLFTNTLPYTTTSIKTGSYCKINLYDKSDRLYHRRLWRGNTHPPPQFLNFLFTYLFSIKFLYHCKCIYPYNLWQQHPSLHTHSKSINPSI